MLFLFTRMMTVALSVLISMSVFAIQKKSVDLSHPIEETDQQTESLENEISGLLDKESNPLSQEVVEFLKDELKAGSPKAVGQQKSKRTRDNLN